MKHINIVNVSGLVASAPVVKSTNAGLVATFTIGSTASFFQGGKRVFKTEWVRIVVWHNDAADVRDSLVKGQFVSVQGRLATRRYTDVNGVERFVTEVIATSLVFDRNIEPSVDEFVSTEPICDDEIPF